ncbi:MAG: UvrD-helicase domain-containing protein [Bacteroidales bacterium]|nr:UvrD-helicase domain-containing protein [Bacteroidales bacterium]
MVKEGPVMIIAGAGSGKTRTLTYRIAHLIDEGVDSFNILALTFTNKAAKEMKERIETLVGPEAKNIWMGTFHSIFARILRFEADKIGYIHSFTIYDTDDSKNAIKQIVKQLNLDPKNYNHSFVHSRISAAKSSLMSPEDYASNPEIQQSDIQSKKPLIGEIYRLYNQRLRNAMAMDFDDLLFNTNILLRDFPEVLLKYQERFRYILVDEYQDTNFAQYLIVKKLAARYENICVVGDDAQSIYAFRGANIQNILNFKRDYPSAQQFKLEQNYRSTQNIVNAANSVIFNNKEQIFKNVWTSNAVGERITLLTATDERTEGAMIANTILSLKAEDNAEYRHFAVLYRNNVQSRAIEDALIKSRIPYKVYSGISFYRRKELKDTLAYLRLVVNNHDDEALLRIINYPKRGIGDTTMEKIQLAASDNEISCWTVIENIGDFGLDIGQAALNKINDFKLMIQVFTSQLYTLNAYDLAKDVIYKSGVIRELKSDEDPDNANRVENIEELLNAIQEFCEKEDDITPGSEGEDAQISETTGLKTLDMYLQQVLLLTDEDKDDKNADQVSLMTIHSAKGLEFPYVFVAGMEENLFPSQMSVMDSKDLEEERRLFYVAVTRAEKRLILSNAQFRYQWGKSSSQELSRFVNEIEDKYIDMPRQDSMFPKIGELPRLKPLTPKKPLNSPKLKRVQYGPTAGNTAEQRDSIQAGMRVMHAKFGEGKVLSVEGEGGSRAAMVFFPAFGQKKMMLQFAKLEII